MLHFTLFLPCLAGIMDFADPPFSQSTVKSEYHCATLVGNWEEDRRQFGSPLESDKAKEKIDDKTTYKVSFKAPTAAQAASAKPPGCFAAEAPHALLFYHGDIAHPEKYCYSTSELAYTNPRKEIFTHDEVLDMPGVSRRRGKSAVSQRTNNGKCRGSMRGAMNDDDNHDEIAPAVQREATFLQTMRSGGSIEAATNSSEGTSTGGSSGYAPPRLLPLGRVADRERLMTTKNVTIDSTGVHLFDHLEPYPLTSSNCIGHHMRSCHNPMHKTQLRVHYMEDDY